MAGVIHVFRPRRTLPEDLEAIFVGREHLIEDMLVHLNRWEAGVTRQHYLLIGPRGIGKTNLLIILENRVKKSFTLVVGGDLEEFRCPHCGALLLKGCGLEKSIIEIKCRHCKAIVRNHGSML